MRDPNRIPEFTDLLKEGWSKVPDWRFGQLIENLKKYCDKPDLFYIEDDEMAKIIKEYFDLDDN